MRSGWVVIPAAVIGLTPAFAGGLRNIASTNPCIRYEPGSTIVPTPDLFSRHGELKVELAYRTGTGADGNSQFCYVMPDGRQNPTLHLFPGDRLLLTLKNETPAPAAPAEMQMMKMAPDGAEACGSSMMDASSTNLHYHGTNLPPTCHQDEVIRTLVNAGESFTYDITIPDDEPPGLYWYHPHIHGISEAAVQGGASGAIVVEGIRTLQPETSKLSERILVIRDQVLAGGLKPGGAIPAWDLSVNSTPVLYPKYQPVVIPIRANERELWRVVNAGADAILDLQLRYDGVAQPLRVVALDGVPLGSQDGMDRANAVTQNHILLPPAGRAEFIVTGPSAQIKNATLMTLAVDTGPDGDNDLERPLATFAVSKHAPKTPYRLPPAPRHLPVPRFFGLDKAGVTSQRKIFFSEVMLKPGDPDSPTNFYISVDGQTPTLFSGANPPSITTTQGAVEEWVVENRSQESHVFHIHQIHFLVLEKNGVPVPTEERQYLDTITVPYWSGTGPYPSVKLKMDFRGQTVGDFVYHCHILEHEDNGMMAIIRVKPSPAQH